MNTTTTTTATAQRSIFIEGRLWLDKTWGNTYHSVSVSVDGVPVFRLGMAYGYGNQYETRALEWLKTLGYIETLDVRRSGLDYYVTDSHGLMRELFTDWMSEDALERFHALPNA